MKKIVSFLRRKPFPQIAMSIVSVVIFFGGAEMILRWQGFEANLPTVVFEGKDNAGGRIIPETLPDPELLWKFKPGAKFQGMNINSLGFRAREVDPVKAPNTTRIICMGDSVTAQGRPPYAHILNNLLQEKPLGPGGWESFNVGVHGYSVLQGSILFDRIDPILDPDIVTVFFGWNDHWLDRLPLSQQMAVRMGSFSGKLYEALSESRLFSYLVVKLNPTIPLLKPVGDDWVPRVPPVQYRESLAGLVRKIKASNALPVLITAPRRDLTKELIRKHYARDLTEAEGTHDAYIQITREVAIAEDVPLLDLAKILEGQENDHLFAPDGIHFDFYKDEGSLDQNPDDQPGLQRIAGELYLFLSNVVTNSRPG